MRSIGFLFAPLLAFLCACAAVPAMDDTAEEPAPEERSVAGAVLLYVPNRLFDLQDMFRLRLRIGPGLGAGVRATELADVTLGAWAAIFVGVRGPRGEPEIPWPFGFDTMAGAEVSVLDLSTEQKGPGPHYGTAEFGFGFHLFFFGLEIGLDPWEVVDLLVGLAGLDPVGDDF